ncbi:MAG: D-aminoacyl-tRNA deacylase [Bilifractor sp.]|jgi:D-tyrosyl-tRNA(Tyr) deacylase|nr:D-aminoacyl-tRNA deacylase [Lachnospiraceae bacterium]
MRFVIQRVTSARVDIDGETVGSIGKGYMVLIGVGKDDTEETADKYLSKMLKLRIFEDENGKTNKSLADVNGELLLVSQFTLYADCRHGNRPGFTNAGAPEMAEKLYDYIVSEAKKTVPVVETGRFGADMQVSLVNDGPFTIILEDL